MATIGYTRVSSKDQRLDRQDLGEIDHFFSEKESAGRGNDRPELERCLAYLRDCDTLRVASVDRLARSLRDLIDIVERATSLGARVEFLKENLVFDPCSDDPFAKAMLHMVGTFAELERDLIRVRQQEGIVLAKERGVYKGRKPSLSPESLRIAKERHDMGVPLSRLASDFGVGKTTMADALAGVGPYSRGAYAGIVRAVAA